MTPPELDILHQLMARLDILQQSATDDLAWLGDVPATLSEFENMAGHRKSASRAVLKSFEQIEDQLARAFRAVPRLMGVDARRWFARDHADFMPGRIGRCGRLVEGRQASKRTGA